MSHKNFGIKPKCCGQDMFLDYDDDEDCWFTCNVAGPIHTTAVPDGYFDDTPQEHKEGLGDILAKALADNGVN